MDTLSLLAGIDLLTGEAIPLVSESHKSSDFINFLKILDEKYPEGDTIRLILDNHSAHTSKETNRYLATLLERKFVFVLTPTHASWLNMIESFFSKMTKQMLKGIRVVSKEELSERIYHYFDETNAEPYLPLNIQNGRNRSGCSIKPQIINYLISNVLVYNKSVKRHTKEIDLVLLLNKSDKGIFSKIN